MWKTCSSVRWPFRIIVLVLALLFFGGFLIWFVDQWSKPQFEFDWRSQVPISWLLAGVVALVIASRGSLYRRRDRKQNEDAETIRLSRRFLFIISLDNARQRRGVRTQIEV